MLIISSLTVLLTASLKDKRKIFLQNLYHIFHAWWKGSSDQLLHTEGLKKYYNGLFIQLLRVGGKCPTIAPEWRVWLPVLFLKDDKAQIKSPTCRQEFPLWLPVDSSYFHGKSYILTLGLIQHLTTKMFKLVLSSVSVLGCSSLCHLILAQACLYTLCHNQCAS